MGGLLTLVAVALLAGSSWTLGMMASSRLAWPELRAYERAVMACLGAIAPVTDDDALAYVIPIARHIADTGAVREWTDQARSAATRGERRDGILPCGTRRAGRARGGRTVRRHRRREPRATSRSCSAAASRFSSAAICARSSSGRLIIANS